MIAEVHVFGRGLFGAYFGTTVLVEPREENRHSNEQFIAHFVCL
jgi:hypothetical protein